MLWEIKANGRVFVLRLCVLTSNPLPQLVSIAYPASLSAREVGPRQQRMCRGVPVAHQHRHQEDFERRSAHSFQIWRLPGQLPRHRQEQRPLRWEESESVTIYYGYLLFIVLKPWLCPFPVQVGSLHQKTISGGGLPTSYKAVQFHLHWGTNGGPGSEHTIDGEQFPMEVMNNTKLAAVWGPCWERTFRMLCQMLRCYDETLPIFQDHFSIPYFHFFHISYFTVFKAHLLLSASPLYSSLQLSASKPIHASMNLW